MALQTHRAGSSENRHAHLDRRTCRQDRNRQTYQTLTHNKVYLRRSAGGRSFLDASVGGFIAANSLKSLWRTTGSMSPLSVRHKLPSEPCTAIAQRDDKHSCVCRKRGPKCSCAITEYRILRVCGVNFVYRRKTTLIYPIQHLFYKMLTAFSPCW